MSNLDTDTDLVVEPHWANAGEWWAIMLGLALGIDGIVLVSVLSHPAGIATAVVAILATATLWRPYSRKLHKRWQGRITAKEDIDVLQEIFRTSNFSLKWPSS